jgi:hypothetical protein
MSRRKSTEQNREPSSKPNPAKVVFKEITSRTKIPHEAVGRLIRNKPGFIGVWWRSVSEDEGNPGNLPPISFELELATGLLFVYDSQEAAEELVLAWWAKHGIEPDFAVLTDTVSSALRVTEDYRAKYRKKHQKINTGALIVSWLNHDGPASPVQIANKADLSVDAVRKQLVRMLKEEKPKVRRIRRGLYAIEDQ